MIRLGRCFFDVKNGRASIEYDVTNIESFCRARLNFSAHWAFLILNKKIPKKRSELILRRRSSLYILSLISSSFIFQVPLFFQRHVSRPFRPLINRHCPLVRLINKFYFLYNCHLWGFKGLGDMCNVYCFVTCRFCCTF